MGVIMTNEKLKILFMGTPEFAVPTLEFLIENYNVVGVVTQTDKPTGRGHNIKYSPVKEVAIKNNINVLQPAKIKENKEFLDNITALNPDVIIVVAYGKILPKEVLNYPKYGCINSHASLLPRHRGAAPINFAILSGDKKTGITTMYMDEGLDTGDIIKKYETEIYDGMTAGELHDKLKVLSAEAIKDTLELLNNNSIVREKQDDFNSTYAFMLNKDSGRIDFTKNADEIINLINGLNPWPVAYCIYEEKKLKVYSAKKNNNVTTESNDKFQCGQIINVDNEGILVKCGNGCILITSIQFENKKVMSVKSFLNGNTINKVMLI